MNVPTRAETLPDNPKYSDLLTTHRDKMKYLDYQFKRMIGELDTVRDEVLQELRDGFDVHFEMDRECFLWISSIYEGSPMAKQILKENYSQVWTANRARINQGTNHIISAYANSNHALLTRLNDCKQLNHEKFREEVKEGRKERKKEKKILNASALVNKKARIVHHENRRRVKELAMELVQYVWEPEHPTHQARPLTLTDPDPEILFGPN